MPTASIDASIPVARETAVQYTEADGRALLLDAAYPEGEPERPRPAVVHVYENGWAYGTREDLWNTPYLATHGFFAVSIDHRLSGEAKFPAQIHDVMAAIRWVRANAGRYGADPDRIGILGLSAGGHLAALAGLTGDLPELEGDIGPPGYSSRVQAVAMGSGPSDFLRQGGQMPEYVTRLFGGTQAEKPDEMRLGSPLYHVGPGSPPFLIVHATLDETVPFEQAQWLHSALSAAGVEAHLVRLPGRYHNWTGRVEVPSADEWRMRELAIMALPFLVRHLRP